VENRKDDTAGSKAYVVTNKSMANPPVVVNASVPDYDFDIHPNCQYWLSTRAFNAEYIRLFGRYVYIHMTGSLARTSRSSSREMAAQ
jgi:hypothetical protein